MKKLLAVLAILLTLSGCSTVQDTPVQTTGTPAPTEPAAAASQTGETPTQPLTQEEIQVSEEPSPSDIIRYEIDTGSGKTAVGISVQDRSITSFDFLGDCDNLKQLTFERCIIAEGVVLPYIESLDSVALRDCNTDAVNIVQNNTQLTGLGLGLNMTDLSILEILPNITVLYLTGNDIKDLSPLSACDQLETLYLFDGNYDITTLQPLFGLQKLSHIGMNLRTYRNIAREDLEHYGADPDAIYPEGIIEVD